MQSTSLPIPESWFASRLALHCTPQLHATCNVNNEHKFSPRLFPSFVIRVTWIYDNWSKHQHAHIHQHTYKIHSTWYFVAVGVIYFSPRCTKKHVSKLTERNNWSWRPHVGPTNQTEAGWLQYSTPLQNDFRNTPGQSKHDNDTPITVEMNCCAAHPKATFTALGLCFHPLWSGFTIRLVLPSRINRKKWPLRSDNRLQSNEQLFLWPYPSVP